MFLKNQRAFIFSVKQVTLGVKSFWFSEMKETTGPVTQHHIAEDFNSNNCVRTSNITQICLACECSNVCDETAGHKAKAHLHKCFIIVYSRIINYRTDLI